MSKEYDRLDGGSALTHANESTTNAIGSSEGETTEIELESIYNRQIDSLCLKLAQNIWIFWNFSGMGEAVGSILELLVGSNYSVLIAGQVNSGKSTLCRELVNSLLSSDRDGVVFPLVAWIDCDSGQPEFTAPCLVSLHLLSTAVKGGPLEHMKQPELQFFIGSSSPREDKEYYIQCIFALLNRYKELASTLSGPLPLVINTNGWVKGAGGVLLGRIAQFAAPSLIVQLLNEADHLAGRDLTEFHSWAPSSGLLSLRASDQAEAAGKNGLTARNTRDLMITKYFQSDQTPLASAVPYRVPWTQLRVRFMLHEVPPSMSMYALNGAVVGLCYDATKYQLAAPKTLEEHRRYPLFLSSTPICECVGLGLIRAIDPDQCVYYIVTPLPLEQLARVNTILKGNVELPTTALIDGGVVHAPYLCSNSLTMADHGSGITPMAKKRPDLPRRRLA